MAGSHALLRLGQQSPLQTACPTGQQVPFDAQPSPGAQQFRLHTLAGAQQVMPSCIQVWPALQQFEPQELDGSQQVLPPTQAWPAAQQFEPHALPLGQQVLFPMQVWPDGQQFPPHAVRPAEQHRGGAAQLSPVPQQKEPELSAVLVPQNVGQQGGPMEEGVAPLNSDGPSI